MNFDGRRVRFEVTYYLLQNFARRLNMPFDVGTNIVNIIGLRGAKPVHAGNTVDTLQEVRTQIEDYDALHEFQVDVAKQIEKVKKFLAELKTSNPPLYQLIHASMPPINNRVALLGWFSGMVKVMRLGDLVEELREIKDEVDRLNLVERASRLNARNVADDRYQLELADNVTDRYNDVLILVWKDRANRPHIRALLGSLDPGSRYIENPMGGHPGAAVLPQGSYTANWGRHHEYQALHINGGGKVSGIRITDYHRDQGAVRGDSRAARADDTITVTEYTFYDKNDDDGLSGIRMHAGGSPGNIIFGWSGGCLVLCGSRYPDSPATTYEQIFGDSGDDSGAWLRIGNQTSFNLLIWDAWSLYLLFQESRGGRGFKPNLQIGAADVATDLYPGETSERWVDKMQDALHTRLELLVWYQHITEELFSVFIDQLHELRRDVLPDAEREYAEEWRLFLPLDMEFPQIEDMLAEDERGVFANLTAAALRTFQLACFLLLRDGRLNVVEHVNTTELLWERNHWLCGPETWKLLESDVFTLNGLRIPLGW